jgi:hypothetical protein
LKENIKIKNIETQLKLLEKQKEYLVRKEKKAR